MRPSERDRRFIAYLCRLTQTRARAELARSLGKTPGLSLSVVRWLAPWTRGLDARDFRLLHLVAALHATHPAHEPGVNLGAALARLARRHGMTGGLERRFMALLEADREDLAGHLRRVIGLARDHNLPLDWAQLLSDLRRWDDPGRGVQLAWARAFWADRNEPFAADDEADSPAQVSGCSPAQG